MPERWYRRGPGARNLGEILPETLAALIALALYARTLRFGFVFDDHSLIGPAGPVWVGGAYVPYRPLRYASFWLDHWLGAGAAWSYHLGNVLLHAVASVLVVRLCRRAGASGPAALLGAALFIVHPLGVEAVAYVSGRRDLLAAALGLAAITAWTSRRGLASLAIACAVLAVGAKEAALVVLPQLLAASLCGLGIPARLALGPLAAATVAAIALPVAYGARGPLAPTGSVVSNLALAGDVALHYGSRIVAPTSLAVEYPGLQCPAGGCGALLTPGALVVGIALVVGAAACVALLLRQARTRASRVGLLARAPRAPGSWLAFASVWTMSWVTALCFVIGTHEPGADRHAYPLVAALAVLLAASANHLPARRRAAATALLSAWLGWMTGLSVERSSIWRDDFTLWGHEARMAGASARVHHNFAAELAARGRYGHARRELRSALAIDRSYWPSHLGLAGIDCVRGRTHSAAAHLAEAAALGAPAEQRAALDATCVERAARR
jgi:hypothetical protein